MFRDGNGTLELRQGNTGVGGAATSLGPEVEAQLDAALKSVDPQG
jgi:hypothetical protein